MNNTKIEIDKNEFLSTLMTRMQRTGVNYDVAGIVYYTIQDIFYDLEHPYKVTTEVSDEVF